MDKALLVPALRLGHGDPTVEIVGRSIDMPDPAWGHSGRHHVADLLDKGDDRHPVDLGRHVRASWSLHPRRLAPQARNLEENDRVGGILQIDHSHRTPTRRGLIERIALRGKAEQRLVAKPRQPNRAPSGASLGHPAPSHAVPGRPRPESALKGIGDYVKEIGRQDGVPGTEAEPEQIEARAPLLW